MSTPDSLTPDLCVIGAGSGGLSVAAGAAQMGAAVVLIEKGAMGGDCLNTGCVPSKAMLAAAHAAEAGRAAVGFGVAFAEPAVDFRAVHDHVHDVIAGIAPHDSVERFEGLGVTVIQAAARFVDADTLEAGDKTVKARRFVVATGSRAMVPPIDGLTETPFLTNETIFSLTERPEHLIVLGGGPIGIEMAQAHRRLGSAVTVMEMASILPKDDPEMRAVVWETLVSEGIVIREGVKVTAATGGAGGVAVTIESDGGVETVSGSHLLVAAGRTPNTDGLGLDAAGIAFDRRGITVDKGLKTTNRRVYAIGDVAGGPQFTHVAGYHAGVVIKSALFRLPAKVDYAALPWVTYTDPELANVGLTEAMAKDRLGAGRYQVIEASFADNDRARAEKRTEGRLKAILDSKGRVLGCSIVGPHAGELILPWSLAIQEKMKIGKLATLIAPYPTLSEVTKRAAGSYFTPKLFSERTRKIVRFLARFG